MITMQIFIKQDYLEYMRKSLLDPVRLFFKSQAEHVSQDIFETISNFINNDYVYIPIAFSLISSGPNYSALEKLLDSMVTLVNNNEKDLFTELLKHIIYEIPLPQKNSVYNILLPTTLDMVEVYNKVYDDKPVLNYSSFNIFKYFTVENVELIIRLMLFEKKIIFVTDKSDWELVSKVCESFLSLIYPISWVHFYQPTMSYEIFKYVQSFLPYIIGLDICMLESVLTYLDPETEIFIVNIFENSVFSLKYNKKIRLKNSEFLPCFPKNAQIFLTKELSTLKISLNGNEGLYLDKIIFYDLREIFVKFMAFLFEDYKNYSVMIHNVPNFNSSNFIENQQKENRGFYKEIVESQNFLQFVQASYMLEEKEYMKFYESTCSNFRSIYHTELKNTTTLQKFKIDLSEFSKKRPSLAEQNYHSFKLTIDQTRKSHSILKDNFTIDRKNSRFNSTQISKDTFASRNRAKTIASNYLTDLTVKKKFDILYCSNIKNDLSEKHLQPFFIQEDKALRLEEIEDIIFSLSEKLSNKNLNILLIGDIAQLVLYLNKKNGQISTINKYEVEDFPNDINVKTQNNYDSLNLDKKEDCLTDYLSNEKYDEIKQQTDRIEKKRLTIVNKESSSSKPHSK
jgi:hypothetical protein